jgi:hypothetical protein
MKELGMHHVAAKFVPRILTPDQTQQRTDICTEIHQLTYDNETFLFRVITGDESWVYSHDPETKQQSSQWKSLKAKKGQTGEKQRQQQSSPSLTSRGLCAKNLSQQAEL